MAYVYLNWCFIAAVLILNRYLIGVSSLPSKLPQLKGLDPGILVIEQPSDPIVALKKSSVLINCSVISSDEHGQVLYYWKKDGVRLNNKEHRSRLDILNNGSLYIRRIIHSEKGNIRTDEGFYECFATNDVGTVVGRRVQIIITRIAKAFSESPETQAVGIGGVAYLACKIKAVPETLYVWHKNNEILNTNHRRFRILKNSKSLVITNIEPSDTGTYNCFAAVKAMLTMDASSSQPRWRYTSEAVVNITHANTILPLRIWRKPQTNMTVLVNESTIIDCIVTSQPQPVVTWTWNGKAIPKYTEILLDGSLSVSKISTNMAGVYNCMAKVPGSGDDYTSIGKTYLYVETTVRTFPAITKGPSSSAHKIARHSILKCEVSGIPKPNVTWLKNGEVVQPDGRHEILEDKNLYRIFNSGESDSGYYQCLVENSKGWTSALARLKIDQNVLSPKPPKTVNGEGISESEIIVSWTLDETVQQLPMLGFTVHYTEIVKHDSYPGFREVNVAVSYPSHFTSLTHLKANTNYTIYVKAYNKYGASVDSSPIIAQTLDSVPWTFPSPTITSHGYGKLLVEWNPLKEEDRGGIITSYQIFYGKTSETKIKVLNISANQTDYIITGLEANTKYRLRMLAGTKKGFPIFKDEDWPWIYHYIHLEIYHHSSIFPTVNITVINSSTVEISWKYHGPVDLAEQIIFLRNLKQMTSAKVINYDPTSRQINLTHLAQNSFHEFFLVVKSRSLATGSVSKLFYTSISDIKKTVEKRRPDINIIASLLEPNQISLSWNYPKTDRDILLYKVRCEMMFGFSKCDKKSKITYFETHSNSAVVTGLDAYTWYNISVKAESRDGGGIYSNPSLVLTREDIPSPPEHVIVRVISSQQVVLEWSRPAYPNGVIKGHYISYSDKHFNPDKWPHIYQEGMMNTANISNLTKPLYYFLIRACTLAGQGHPSQIVKVFMKIDEPGNLSDQHLGIIGGATIGMTCILITVCVIFIKQRQIQKRFILNQTANSVPCPHGCVATPIVPSSQLSGQNHVCKSEELWSLLTPSDKSTAESPCLSNDTHGTIGTETSDIYCHITSC